MRTSVSASAALALVLAVLVPISGCSSSSSSEAPQKPIEKICTKTACDEKMSAESSACSRCIDACLDASYACGPSTECERSCESPSTCSDRERSQCLQQTIVIHLDVTSSPELLASCNGVFNRLDQCNLEIRGRTRAVCATWAEVERPESAAFYACVAAKGCKEDTSTCDVPATSTLGDEICDAINARFESDVFCGATDRKTLNENGAWWKDEVVAVERACLALPDANDVLECHQAWKAAVGF